MEKIYSDRTMKHLSLLRRPIPDLQREIPMKKMRKLLLFQDSSKAE